MKYLTKNNCLLILLLALFTISSIGGCGSSGSDNGNGQDNPETVSMEEASRFLSMATLGADYEEIEKVAEIGKEGWLEEQFNQPIGYNLPFTLELLELAFRNNFEEIHTFRRYSWWQQVMTSPDLLRQRVAFALSEIFVVSDRVDMLANHPEGLSSYYDILLKNAFGNFRDLFLDVTLHPVMGVYLSHINNKKANPEINRFPDENYAREAMQLFSIGLDELNPDGTVMTDSKGFPIATYDNSNITEFAKVYTGLVSAPAGDLFPERRINFIDPMVMNEEFHETGEKTLLNGQALPAGQGGMKDIEDAIDHLFNHPNAGPFICKKLIQRLVTSNPEPDYVQRVAKVFADNGSGVRGDLRAVIKAILLDKDASDPAQPGNQKFGKFHEPWVRYVSILRHFNAATPDGYYLNNGYLAQFFLNQHVLSSPSVFNFFLPNFKPNGIIGENNLVAPEFQIITSSTIINHPNLIFIMVFLGELLSLPDFEDRDGTFFLPVNDAVFDFSDEIAIADDPAALVDRLDLILTYGQMSDGMKQIIIDAVNNFEDPLLRVQTALYLFMISPEYVVQN